MSTRLHSFKNNTLEWDGLNFLEGVADGTSIVESMTTDNTSTIKHGDGSETVSDETDKGGTLAVTVVLTSDLHSALKQKLETQKQTGLPAVKDSQRRNLVSGEVTTYRNMRIQGVADGALGVQATTGVWVFRWEAADYTAPATGLTNQIGS